MGGILCICGISIGNFTGKINHLRLPVFTFIQVTGGGGGGGGVLQRDVEQTGERDCRGLTKILRGGGRAGETNPRLYCTCI